jgi:DUF1680 family protein
MYSVADDGVYVDLYGGNVLHTTLKDGAPIVLEQQTDYPWDGYISVVVKEAPVKETGIFMRIPGWCKKASLSVNGKVVEVKQGGYAKLFRHWKAGDRINLVLDMPATLIEANPLVEETKNQVAVKRGPLVYCLESVDLRAEQQLSDIIVPSDIKLQQKPFKIDNGNVMALEGDVRLLQHNSWSGVLYKELNDSTQTVRVKWIPYYAWANRGKSDMSVWLPLSRR